jgi:hypothetical protein
MRAAILVLVATAGCIDFDSLATRYRPGGADASLPSTGDGGAPVDLARGGADLAGANEGCPELDLTSDPLHCGACDHDWFQGGVCRPRMQYMPAIAAAGGRCGIDAHIAHRFPALRE